MCGFIHMLVIGVAGPVVLMQEEEKMTIYVLFVLFVINVMYYVDVDVSAYGFVTKNE